MSVFNDKEDIDISTRILFHQSKAGSMLRLAIGAPSSPPLSNVLMFNFDSKMSELVSRDHVTYTRYADDLTFSAKRTGFLNGVERTLRQLIREMRSPSLKINEAKTVLATRKHKRLVTGLVLTNDGEVSIGYERKRALRAALHHAELGRLDRAQKLRLRGLLAFVQAVEPTFFDRLVDRYGSTLITNLTVETLPPEGG